MTRERLDVAVVTGLGLIAWIGFGGRSNDEKPST